MSRRLAARSSILTVAFALCLALPASAETLAVVVMGAEPEFEPLAAQASEVLLAQVGQRHDGVIVGREEFLARLGFRRGPEVESCVREVPCLARVNTVLGVGAVVFGYLGGDAAQYRLFVLRVRTDGTVLGQAQRSVDRRDEILLGNLNRVVQELYEVKAAELRVETPVAGAAVYLDDRPVGRTPLLLPKVELGLHRVRVEAPGYVTSQQAVDLTEAGVALRVSLLPVVTVAAEALVPPPVLPPAGAPLAAPAVSASPGSGSRAAGDDPRVSRSPGVEGGVVLLWPRILPASAAERSGPELALLHRHMLAMVQRVLPGRPIDERPAPERVCPRAGCAGLAFGAVFLRQGEGCAVAATVGPPGQVPLRIVPWVGQMRLKANEAQFREPPENQVVVRDFAPCADLGVALQTGQAPVGFTLEQLAPVLR